MRSSTGMAKKKSEETKKSSKNDRVYPSEEQGIEPRKTREKAKEEMSTGEKEADVYSKVGRDALREDDEVDDWEEGFMDGAEGGGQRAKCMKCGAEIEVNTCVEKELDGELKWFCSAKCLAKYEKEKK